MYTDDGKFVEMDVENWLYQNPQVLQVDSWVGKQIIMPSGRLDLLGIIHDHEYDYLYELVLVEIKKHGASAESFVQISRYAKDIDIILNEFPGYCCCTDIKKIIVSNNYSSLDKQLLFEAEALDIRIIGYRAKIEFELSGFWEWTKQYQNEKEKVYKDLANSDAFEFLRKIQAEAMSNE